MLNDFIHQERIAYFSMEVALSSEIPTYAGGLGILAGDTVRSAADLELPLVTVSLVSRAGYFRQEIDGADCLDMTRLALNLSEYINGVAKRHAEISRRMFPGYRVHAITNGVHPHTWPARFQSPTFRTTTWHSQNRSRQGSICGSILRSDRWKPPARAA
jgi:glucan phosphorylase